MPLADRLAPADADAGPAATSPLPPGHPQAAELERLRLLYERGALAGADYWAVRAYILEQAMRAGVGGGRGGPPPLTPRDRLLGGVLWAAGFMLVLLAAGGVWKAGELLVGRSGAGTPETAITATSGPGAGFGDAYGPGEGSRGWSLEAGADWLLGRPPRPPNGFGPHPRAPFVARAHRGFGDRDAGPWGGGASTDAGPPGPPPDGFGGGFGGDAGRNSGPPGPPPDGFRPGFGPGFGPPGGRPPPH